VLGCAIVLLVVVMGGRLQRILWKVDIVEPAYRDVFSKLRSNWIIKTLY
jgi:hypothetical protein